MLFPGIISLPPHTLLLAPMENITHTVFRCLCRRYGADMVFTEFVSAEELLHNRRRTLEKLTFRQEERPLGIQLYGHRKEEMTEAARRIMTYAPDVLDINFGCPARKIARRGAGAGMLKNIPAMVGITAAIVQAASCPVTVKTRLGWDRDHLDILEITLRLQDAGIRAITIHGRTGDQGYGGKADWTLIGEVKNHPGVHIPVFGNGDIRTPEDAKERFQQTGVDGIMIGRAAIGKPWIFRDIREYFRTGTVPPAPGLRERVELASEHLTESVKTRGLPRGVYEMRSHLILYFKEFEIFQHVWKEMITCTDPGKILELMNRMTEH
ncbi:MAG TPA: tRNA dihydrouridine synthase DusB [Bacteroidetes bacterium]|nr:tRNA dihydrouridine synthase DusB [Bacteroidota bacterium]